MQIFCCKDCIPPKRHIGCHSDCEEYLKDKLEYEKKKEESKKIKNQLLTDFDFNKIGYTYANYHRKR